VEELKRARKQLEARLAEQEVGSRGSCAPIRHGHDALAWLWLWLTD
jgi:hypothetical protein